MRKIANYYG